MREIILTKGYVALVDDEDYEYLNKMLWQGCVGTNTVYAKGTGYIRGHHKRGSTPVGPKTIMHRVIMGVTDDNLVVDHIDHNGLNNQKSNLRIVTSRQNAMNCSKRINGVTSKYKGVSWHVSVKKYRAYIGLGYKNLYLGQFDHEVEAAKAYNEAAIKYFGEFAVVNNIPDEFNNGIILKAKKKGVSRCAGVGFFRGRWRASIWLGAFDTEEAAIEYVLSAKKKLAQV